MSDLTEERDALRIEAQACHDQEGNIAKFERWAEVRGQLRAVNKAIADLTRQYQDVWQRGKVQKELFAWIAEEFRDEPDRARALAARLEASVIQVTGMPGQSEPSNG